MKKKALHWSHLATFMRCAEQYYRRYILGQKIAPGIALIIGSSTHKSIESNMKNYIMTGELLPLEAILDIARDSVMHRWGDEGVTLMPEEKKKGEKKVRADAIDMAVGLSALHRKELAPTIKPTHVERPWKVMIKGYPYDLAGTIDLMEKDLLIDTKTAARTPPDSQIHSDHQLTVYAMAANVIDHKIPKLRKDFLIKTKAPKVVQHTSTRDEKDFEVVLRRIETLSLAIQAGIFPPADPTSWICSERFCGYYGTCKYIRRRK